MKNPSDSENRSLWQIIAALILVFAFGFLAWRLRAALYPLLFGLLIAVAAFPAVRGLESRRYRRTLATFTVSILGFLLAAFLLFVLAAQLVNLFGEFFAVGPGGEKTGAAYKAIAEIEKLYSQLDQRFQLGARGKEWIENLPQQLASSWKEIATGAGGAMQFVASAVGSMLDILSLLFLTPLFAFLILLEFEKLRGGLLRLARPENRTHAAKLFDQIEEMLGNFIRGRLLTGLIKGAGQALLLWICGVPYPFLAGALSWVLSFIPVVGPALAMAPSLLLLAASGSWSLALVVILILILGEIVEGYYLIPKIVGSGVGLNTLELLLAILIGGAALGVLGLFLAVPFAAAGKLFLLDYLEKRDHPKTA